MENTNIYYYKKGKTMCMTSNYDLACMRTDDDVVIIENIFTKQQTRVTVERE